MLMYDYCERDKVTHYYECDKVTYYLEITPVSGGLIKVRRFRTKGGSILFHYDPSGDFLLQLG